MRTDSRELLAVGIFGRASLSGRIETLLKRGRDFSTRASHGRIAASVATLLLFAAVSAFAPRWIAFAQPVERPSFEVASVKPARSERRSMRVTPQGINYTAVTLMECIAEAWQVRYTQIAGRAVTGEKFDVEARASDAITSMQRRLMLQSLLEDRFKLRLHHEERIMSVYELVSSGTAAQLRESQAEGEGRMIKTAEGFEFRNVSMYLFSAILSGRLGRPVLDRTGLKGVFDFALTLDIETPVDPAQKITASDWSSSAIFGEIQKQLGLKLDADKAAVDYLVADHVEKPDAN